MPTLETPPGAVPFDESLNARLVDALEARPEEWTPRTRHRDGRSPRWTNRLALETSPYLQQHAHNPVNWHPWSEEAFDTAKRLDRPVFLSIGYSTCHWCHVMEEESFEDPEIAAFLNAHFVPVKVDREERPDVDAIYMTAVQALTGRGGWPMSVFLTPQREPFYAGTYFPPRDGARRMGMGFLTLLKRLHQLWATDRARVLESSSSLTSAVREHLGAAPGGTSLPGVELSEEIFLTVEKLYDPEHGGLQRAPKFPTHVPVRLLLRHHRRTGRAASLEMAAHTLEAMAAGGMYDQLAGGFHRYSVDERWLVPHFEKMLYDNALLSVAYAEAHQVTRRADFARVTREILDYVLREMTSPEGGFYSATDADSEGEEGLFFVWTPEEIRAHLDAEIAERFIRHYGVVEGGNFEGRSILHVQKPSEEEWAALAPARTKLREVRSGRVPPLRDDKVLAGWNGLMISGFAVGGRVLGEPRYVDAARRAAAFVLDRMRVDGRLQRSFKDGRARHAGYLDDHAAMMAGLLDLFEATGEERWVREALSLANALEERFADREHGGWFMTADDHETLLVREKPTYDGAEPSGGSVATLSMLRLAALTGDDRWQSAGERALKAYGASAVEQPLGQTELLLAVEFLAGPPKEVVLVSPAADAGSLGEKLRTLFAPHAVRVMTTDAHAPELEKLLPPLEGKRALQNRPTAYVCQQGACELPVSDPEALARQLAPTR